MRADAEGVVAQLAANEAPSRLLRKQVTVGTQWQRYEFTLHARRSRSCSSPWGWTWRASKRDAATLWVDAIQLERGDRATAYEPRQPVESFIETGACRATSSPTPHRARRSRCGRSTTRTARRPCSGKLAVTDFFDRTAFAGQPSAAGLPAHSAASLIVARRLPGPARFLPRDVDARRRATQSLPLRRSLEPLRSRAARRDSPLGFNHAYPWDFLVRLAREAGIVWWRDWSAKWQTVEPEQGRFDFAVPTSRSSAC